jgi:tyrosyl-tRNA synthetase
MKKEYEEILTRGVTRVVDETNLRARLQKGEKLRIKWGVDPTSGYLHLGRAIPVWKLREFFDQGHTIVLVIGDFTATVGDASDKDSERPMLTKEQVLANMVDYEKQLSQILDLKSKRVEIHYNSEWLSNMSFEELCGLTDHFSVAEMLDRDNFSKRYKEGKRISLREFLYPLMQGYDSVIVKADLEIGGNDQYFNLLAGRTLQKAFGQTPQEVMTFELLKGLDGRKMSSSYGNGVFITDTPDDMLCKIMTLRDDLINKYWVLASGEKMDTVQQYEERLAQGENPRDIKLALAVSIVTRYHGAEQAVKAKDNFVKVFSQKQIPDEIEEKKVKNLGEKNLVEVVAEVFGLSKSQARRVVEEKGIKIDGTVEEDPNWKFDPNLSEFLIQKGKRHFIKVKN